MRSSTIAQQTYRANGKPSAASRAASPKLRRSTRNSSSPYIQNGARCRITSAHGSIEIPATLTDEVKRGTVAVPHGWGHDAGGWRLAAQAGGANVNLLASSDPDDLERLAGMAHLNGIPVRLDAVEPVDAEKRRAELAGTA